MTFGLWVETRNGEPQEGRALIARILKWVWGIPIAKHLPGAITGSWICSILEVRAICSDSFSKCLDVGGIEYLNGICNRELYPLQLTDVGRANAQTLVSTA